MTAAGGPGPDQPQGAHRTRRDRHARQASRAGHPQARSRASGSSSPRGWPEMWPDDEYTAIVAEAAAAGPATREHKAGGDHHGNRTPRLPMALATASRTGCC